MATTTQRPHSTGESALDKLLGGLATGDNIVWVGDRLDLHEQIESAFLDAGDSEGLLVILEDAPESTMAVDNARVLDARPGRHYADLVALEQEILHFGSRQNARLVIRGLDALVARLGASGALAFFARTCPRLFDTGAIAYWRASRTGASPILEEIQGITQSVIDHSGGRLRIVKAEDRQQLSGRAFDISIGPDGLVLEEERALSRLADGIRRIRTSRNLTQTEVARLADVSPSAISQVESGQRGLGLDTLLRLSQGLNLSIDELLGYHPDPGFIVARRDRIPSRRGITPLLDDPEAGLRSYFVVLGPGDHGEPSTIHKGAELVLIGTGVVQVILNDETPVLRAGDALLVTTDAIRGWKNLLPEIARLFWIVRD